MLLVGCAKTYPSAAPISFPAKGYEIPSKLLLQYQSMCHTIVYTQIQYQWYYHAVPLYWRSVSLSFREQWINSLETNCDWGRIPSLLCQEPRVLRLELLSPNCSLPPPWGSPASPLPTCRPPHRLRRKTDRKPYLRFTQDYFYSINQLPPSSPIAKQPENHIWCQPVTINSNKDSIKDYKDSIYDKNTYHLSGNAVCQFYR